MTNADLHAIAEKQNLGTVASKMENGAWLIYIHPNAKDPSKDLLQLALMTAESEGGPAVSKQIYLVCGDDNAHAKNCPPMPLKAFTTESAAKAFVVECAAYEMARPSGPYEAWQDWLKNHPLGADLSTYERFQILSITLEGEGGYG